MIKKFIRNAKENKDYHDEIVRKAKSELKSVLDPYYIEEEKKLRSLHQNALDDLKCETESRIRTVQTLLTNEFNKEKQFIEQNHAQEIKQLNQINNNLKQDMERLRSLNDDEKKNLRQSFETEKKEMTLTFSQEKQSMMNQFETSKEEILQKFVEEIRSLRGRLQDKESQLKRARKAYRMYVQYAIEAMHMAYELKAEAELWTMQGAEFSQKMNKISDKFDRIERFNNKNSQVIEALLNYNRETDEELIEDIIIGDGESDKLEGASNLGIEFKNKKSEEKN
jgi:hypothetical protein